MQDNIKKLLKLPPQTPVLHSETKHILFEKKRKTNSTLESAFSKVSLIWTTKRTSLCCIWLRELKV